MSNKQTLEGSIQKVEEVLAFPESVFHQIGFFRGVSREVARYMENPLLLDSLRYLARPAAETDPTWKQLIPYSVLTLKYSDDEIFYFTYARTKKGQEARLHDKLSLGVGGHINPCDGEPQNCYEKAFLRELQEEVALTGNYINEKIGLIYDDSNEVGKVHFGVVHKLTLELGHSFKFTDPSLENGNFKRVKTIKEEINSFENWSQIIIKELL